MNIWILTSEFPPVFGGGISTYCWEAAAAFAATGHSVTVVTRGSSAVEITNPRERLRVIHLPIKANQHLTAGLGYWHLMSYIFAEYVTSEIVLNPNSAPDFIEVQDYGGLGYFLLKKKALGAAELLNKTITVYAHTPVFELMRINQEATHKFPNYWIGQAEKFCYRAADCVLSPSVFLANHIKEYCKKPPEIVAYPFYGHALAELAEHSNKAVNLNNYVYAGRLEYRKGVVQLLAQFSKYWGDGGNSSLSLIGSDTVWIPRQISMKKYLSDHYASFVNSGKLVFVDAMAPNEFTKFITSAKAVLVPSLYENFPYVCMQAMSLGIPVIGSLQGGQAELISKHGHNGFIFDWNEVDSLKNLLKKIDQLHPEELHKIGIEAHHRVSEVCSIKRFVDLRVKLFQSLSGSSQQAHYDYPFAEPIRENVIKEPIERNKITTQTGLLSVVVPFYNLGVMLLNTIESIEQSNYKLIQIIIVNDGSTDNDSKRVLDEIRNNKRHINIIDIPNAGLANARNVGAAHADGQYIAMLDADDLVKPEYYVKCIQILNSCKNVSFVYSWLEYFEGSEGLWITFDAELPYILGANMLAAFLVVRTDDYLNFGKNDSTMLYGMEDYEAWVRMLASGKRGVCIPEALVKYRVRKDSMARQFKRDTVLYLYELIANLNPTIYKEYGGELFKLLNANGPGYLWGNGSIDHPPVGRVSSQVANSDATGASAIGLPYSYDELLRLRRIVTNPFIQKIVDYVLRKKLDKLF